MKRFLLSVFAALLMSSMVLAQSNHPITSASISPNPVESNATIHFDGSMNEKVTVIIKDLAGKVMVNFVADTQGEEFSSIKLDMLETLKRGIYIVQVTGESGKVKTLKFQKT
jgi:hypothetical protein